MREVSSATCIRRYGVREYISYTVSHSRGKCFQQGGIFVFIYLSIVAVQCTSSL